MSYFNNNKKFKPYIQKPKDISSILADEMTIVSGDFYGIQKFIFDRLSTKNASKVLRAKSAFVQIFTEYLAKYICHKLQIDENRILTRNAGIFEIAVPFVNVDIESIQKDVDEYFIKNFYGLSGVVLTKVECKKEDFKDPIKYKKLRERIINSIQNKKFKKFNLNKDTQYVLNYDSGIDNQNLCKVCNIRKSKKEGENCDICDNFIKLGKKLSYEHQEELISSKEVGIEFNGFETDINLDKKIKSYVLFKQYTPVTFEELAENSCIDEDSGTKALAILKADIDNMGKFLEKSSVTSSFEAFDAFSKSIDNFFSLYIPKLMSQKYKNTYTIFAGGDDLFLLGAWNEILELAREIEKDFKEFVAGDAKTLTISFGITLAKPSTPISYLANYTEELLEEAKDIDNGKEVKNPKDAIALFREVVKWDDYKETYSNLENLFKDFDKNVTTATLYSLLKFCDMSKNVKNDIKNTIWRSKLNYLFNRNIDTKYHNILGKLSDSIEKHPEATKMFLSEFIYKRRQA